MRATSCRGVTPADLGNAAFPFMTAQELTVGDVPARALRVTFVGELGWELYASSEYGAALWETLVGRRRAGRPGRRRVPRNRQHAGREGLPGLGQRSHHRDQPRTRPGSGFCVKLDKPGGFEGRDALAGRARPTGLTRRLRAIVLDDPTAVVVGSEPVRVGERGRRPGDLGRLRLHPRRVRRTTRTCRSTAGRALRSTIDLFGNGSAAPCTASRCSTRVANGCSAWPGRRRTIAP